MSYTSMMRDKNRVSKRREPKPTPSAKPNPDMADFDDDLLLILLRNMRNAAATFGEGTPPYENIKKVVEDHLNEMKRKGKGTNIVKTRQKLKGDGSSTEQQEFEQTNRKFEQTNREVEQVEEVVSSPVANLTIRMKSAPS